MRRDVVIVGGGHNGLVAACYLAGAGRDVLVLEALDRPGGGSRTEEVIPGYRFDLHSAAHNMTSIPADLGLGDAGLDYLEMDPFSVAVHDDGRRVRFWRSVQRTVDSIAEHDSAEARAYRQFLEIAFPVVDAVMPAIRGETSWKDAPRRLRSVARVLRRGPMVAGRDLLAPYDTLLRRHLRSDLTRGPVAAFAAHAAVSPTLPGGAMYGFWQAAYHRYGQWHARGGAQGLTDALMVRLRALGGEVRCSARVVSIDAAPGRVRGVTLEDGERIDAATVVTAINPQTALLELLQPPLAGRAGRDLAAVRRGNVVQALIHVATDRLPEYPNAGAGDWNGLQSYVDRLDDLATAWNAAEARQLPAPLPLYAFTPSALDDGLAPAGHHTVYLACPAAPSIVEGGWAARRDEFVDRAFDVVESRAPGFRRSIVSWRTWTPDEMEREEGWPGGHPMHIDIALDQLGPMRPTRSLARHRTPLTGLYISGAGTSPAGGIVGTPGRLAARAVIRDQRPGRRSRRGRGNW
ncbi:MAG: phytoene desaturase family protein [Candidatus Dormibacteria bacterium]